MMQQNNRNCRLFAFKQTGDVKGSLVAIEGKLDIPFEIKRIFYIFGTDQGVIRGRHANRNSEFVLINLCGSTKVKVNNAITEEIYVLDTPNSGLYIPKMVWKDMYDFSPDSVLLVLSNEHYDSTEYIKDFDAYIKEVACNE